MTELLTGSPPQMKGRISTIAITELKPGMAPKIIPMRTPRAI
jgi:hypothetical protein